MHFYRAIESPFLHLQPNGPRRTKQLTLHIIDHIIRESFSSCNFVVLGIPTGDEDEAGGKLVLFSVGEADGNGGKVVDVNVGEAPVTSVGEEDGAGGNVVGANVGVSVTVSVGD